MTDPSRPHRLLFVCTGNICRSPMAEGLARAFAEAEDLEVEVQSASTLGLFDRPADPHAVAVCTEIGVDISEHLAQPLTDALIDWADYVLVMEYRHAEHIRAAHPQVDERLLLLGNFGGEAPEIADPIGGWRFQFRRTRNELQRCVEGFMRRLPPR